MHIETNISQLTKSSVMIIDSADDHQVVGVNLHITAIFDAAALISVQCVNDISESIH